jgi:4-methyl-5(b-hydroxyethyl)-thiazole monophosphate biosynthesis
LESGAFAKEGKKRQAQMKDMGVNIIQQPVVIDKNIITSRSPSAALDVVFAVVEMLTSTANVERIKKGMGFIE